MPSMAVANPSDNGPTSALTPSYTADDISFLETVCGMTGILFISAVARTGDVIVTGVCGAVMCTMLDSMADPIV